MRKGEEIVMDVVASDHHEGVRRGFAMTMDWAMMMHQVSIRSGNTYQVTIKNLGKVKEEADDSNAT
jgi:hypothetical protein